MKQFYDSNLLKTYIKKYNLQDLFSLHLTEIANLVQFEADEMLGIMGTCTEAFYILVEGECIAYSVTGSDKIHCECYCKSPYLLGMVGTLWNEPAINDIRAITPCICLCIPTNFREELLSDIKFLRYTSYTLAHHIRDGSSHFEPVETRLATFILETEQNGIFRFNLTLCAELVETSYRHLLRVLHNFCETGILEKNEKSSYRISNHTQLEEISQGHGLL